MLYLSASFIKDFIECPHRAKLRRDIPEQAIVSDDVIFGEIVHFAIEKFEGYDAALEYSLSEWKKRKTTNSFLEEETPDPPKSFRKMFKGYYEGIVPQINPDGFDFVQKEVMVKHQLDADTMLIGKFDRIQVDKVYDWKTAMKPPDQYDLTDFQFYFYDLLFTLVYDMVPQIYYGYVYGGRVYEVPILDSMRDNTGYIVQEVANRVRAGDDYKVAGYQCRKCFYRLPCYGEMTDELDNRRVS